MSDEVDRPKRASVLKRSWNWLRDRKPQLVTWGETWKLEGAVSSVLGLGAAFTAFEQIWSSSHPWPVKLAMAAGFTGYTGWKLYRSVPGAAKVPGTLKNQRDLNRSMSAAGEGTAGSSHDQHSLEEGFGRNHIAGNSPLAASEIKAGVDAARKGAKNDPVWPPLMQQSHAECLRLKRESNSLYWKSPTRKRPGCLGFSIPPFNFALPTHGKV